jgi:menaquinone-specific isochorismate synthase
VIPAVARDATVAARDLADELDAGLAIARRGSGITAIALPAPAVSAAAVVSAWPEAPAVAWSTADLVLAGVGVAHALRGRGDARWSELVAASRGVEIARAAIGGEETTIAALGDARPRFVGGAAFAPGAADRAPWHGFGDAWFALTRWTYVHVPGAAHGTLVLAVDADAAGQPARWHAELARFDAAWTARLAAPQPPAIAIDRGDTAAWRAHVAAITDAIADGACAKIVAARACVVALAGDARLPELLAALDATQPECTRVLIRPPGGGALVAATPERLVRRSGDVVTCDALAGTAPRGPDAAAALLGSTKDRNEHDLVVRAIAAALREVVVDVARPAEPTVRALRHLVHLHTPIRGVLARPCHVVELAARLHPTPAVGGTPTGVACAWIAAREPVPRGWYASPVGWFDGDGDGEFAVALRGGVLAGDRVHLWAGAGIVAGSDPDRELAETDAKLRAMLGALGVGA